MLSEPTLKKPKIITRAKTGLNTWLELKLELKPWIRTRARTGLKARIELELEQV